MSPADDGAKTAAPILVPHVEIATSAGLLWTPVRTRPRREKKVAEYCAAKAIPCYLPLTRSVKRYGSKTHEFMLPMFPGYTFCQLDEPSFRELLGSHAVLFRVMVDSATEDGLINDLRGVQTLENCAVDKELVVKPELTPGTTVMVKHGPLKGIKGVIQNREGGVMLFVNIEILGNSVGVRLDVGDVELDA